MLSASFGVAVRISQTQTIKLLLLESTPPMVSLQSMLGVQRVRSSLCPVVYVTSAA